jgi:hypothetical protein
MPLTQRRLVEIIVTLPGTTLSEETRRRNDAINAVAAHCQFQEGGAVALGRPSTKQKGPTPVQEVDPPVAAAEAEKQPLDAASLSVFKEKRPTICFLCLGEKLIKSFAKPGDLSKYFKRKHLRHMSDKEPAGVQGLSNALEARGAPPKPRSQRSWNCVLMFRYDKRRILFGLVLFSSLCCSAHGHKVRLRQERGRKYASSASAKLYPCYQMTLK